MENVKDPTFLPNFLKNENCIFLHKNGQLKNTNKKKDKTNILLLQTLFLFFTLSFFKKNKKRQKLDKKVGSLSSL
jgi:hypothetical protein